MKSLTEYLEQLELPVLVDMLAKYTTQYTKMFLEKDFGRIYEECKFNIDLIQKEIYLRLPQLTDRNIPGKIIQFSGRDTR